MFSLKRLLIVFLSLSVCKPLFAQLHIMPQTSPEALAQKLVGSGVRISHVSLSGSGLSTAFFHNEGAQLGIDSGIVLSTGRVLGEGSFYGLNGSQGVLASNQLGTSGDPDLSALVAPKPTADAVVLEFDFIPVGDSIKFRYVFSSEEYPTFNCSDFNDVFAFFISGPGITGKKNLALIPDTDIPVAINSINNGMPGNGYNIASCNTMGAGSPFTNYFVDNSGNSYFTHNGHTTVLTAMAAVQPCQMYHLKIAIADVMDRSYDSGVFLEAESLKSDPIQILGSTPLSNGKPFLAEGCHTGGINILRSKRSPEPTILSLVFGGTAENGKDVALIPATVVIPENETSVFVPITPITDNLPEGTELLKIYVSNGCSMANYYLDSIQIQIRDYDTIAFTPSATTGLCTKNSVQLVATEGFASYQWTPSGSLNNAAVFNPVASPDSSTTYICTAVLGSCQARDSVKIEIKALELLSKKDIHCHNGTGEIRVSGGWEWKQPVQYSINNGSYGSDSSFADLPSGNYLVKIKDATGCTDSIEVSLVKAYPDLNLADSITPASCSGENGVIRLYASGGKFPYSFSVDGGTYAPGSSFTINSGDHMVYVKDSNGCIDTHQVLVGKDALISFSAKADKNFCAGAQGGTIHIVATGGSGQYQYSIDGNNFQQADSFAVTAENLMVTVSDNKGCTTSHAVTIPLHQPLFVNAGKDTSICQGSGMQFHTSSNAADFSWSPSSSLSNPGIANPVASPEATTTYFVTVTKEMCTARDTITVTVISAPVANAGPDSSICYGRTIRLSGSGGAHYAWQPAPGLSDPQTAGPTVRPAQTTDYYLRVYDLHHCPSMQYDTVKITVTESVKVFAGKDTAIARGQPLQMQGRELTSTGAADVQWSPPMGLSNPYILNPLAQPDNDISYTLKLTTTEGCEGSDQVTIKVFYGADIFVPSGFTPNGDGKNDVLRPIPVGMKVFHYFKVLNRWGGLVYATETERNGWDGRSNGQKQPEGTYIWVAEGIDYKGNLLVRKGITTLIR
jgi:gliding motility-associated-like protein